MLNYLTVKQVLQKINSEDLLFFITGSTNVKRAHGECFIIRMETCPENFECIEFTEGNLGSIYVILVSSFKGSIMKMVRTNPGDRHMLMERRI